MNFKKIEWWEKVAFFLLIFSAVILFYYYGIFNSIKSFASAFYNVFVFFSGGGDFSKELPWYMYIVAVTVPLGLILTLLVLMWHSFKRWLKLNIFNKTDIIVIGFGNISRKFYETNKDKNIIVLTENYEDESVKNALDEGAYIYPYSNETFLQFSKKAKEIYILNDDDIENIKMFERLKNVENKSVYIHITNREFEAFFSPNFETVEKLKSLKIFNVFRNSVIEWFENNKIEGEVNTVLENEQVKILLIGWDNVIKEAFYHILNIGHFYNKVPIKIVILNDEVDMINEELGFMFPYLNKYNQKENDLNEQLWDIEVIDLQEYFEKIKNDFNFTNILISYHNIEESMKLAIRFVNLHLEYIEKNKTNIGVYAQDFEFSKHKIKTFGNLEKMLKIENIDKYLFEKKVTKLKEQYAKSYKKPLKDKWLDTIFTYWSNVYAHLHGEIVKREYKKLINSNQTNKININDLKKHPYIGKILKEDKDFENLAKALNDIKGITLEDKIQKFDKFAESEHRRWNAYHILNGFVYAEKTDKNKKEHQCLVNWEKIKENEFNTIKYDYNNIFDAIFNNQAKK